MRQRHPARVTVGRLRLPRQRQRDAAATRARGQRGVRPPVVQASRTRSLSQPPDRVDDLPPIRHANQLQQVDVAVAEAGHAGDLPAEV